MMKKSQKVMSRTAKSLLGNDSKDAVETPGTENGLLTPDTGIMTLADMVHGVGVWMILLTLIQSTVSLHIHERLGAEELSRKFDRISFVILALGCVSINLAMPWAAHT